MSALQAYMSSITKMYTYILAALTRAMPSHFASALNAIDAVRAIWRGVVNWKYLKMRTTQKGKDIVFLTNFF